MPATPRQARFWILTIPVSSGWAAPDELPSALALLRGQREIGRGENAYEHWQLVAHFKKPVSLRQVKEVFNRETHAEPTRSKAAEDYVLKDDTAVDGTRFTLGRAAFQRNNPEHWRNTRLAAQEGRLEEIPDDVFVRYYGNLSKIGKDYVQPPFRRGTTTTVYWGPTGTGKTWRVWNHNDHTDIYTKIPTTKWWDGYRGQSVVLIDEFRGQIELSHMLRWLDEYPCNVEVKGGQLPLKANKFFITSNWSPSEWYPNAKQVDMDALLRRLTVHEITEREAAIEESQ